MSKAFVLFAALSIAILVSPPIPPRPAGPVFGPSYVVTDVQTMNGLTINGLVPQPYVLGTYVRGGDPNSYGTSSACPLGSYQQHFGDPAPHANTLDLSWAHQYDQLPPIVWDLGSPRGAAIVFPNIDHGPFPNEGIEYTVWGSNDPNAAFPDAWTLGTLTAIYTKGWMDIPACGGTESDDWAGEYTFGFSTFRYVAVWASQSITIFNDPSHTTWASTADENPFVPGWQSNDEEIDGVGTPVCTPGAPTASAGPDQTVPVGTTVQFDGRGSGMNVSLYGWDTDGDSVIDLTGPAPSKTFTTPFEGDVRLTVVDTHGCSASDGMHLRVVSNRAPLVASFVASGALEGGTVTFTVAASDPDGDPLTYAFDFESDGTWDVNGSSHTASRAFGDDLLGRATVRVSDGKAAMDATTPYAVGNVPPTITSRITATATADITLRVAGEKWHDVALTVVDGGSTLAVASITRTPGSPDAQAATVRGVSLDVLSPGLGFTVVYTPANDPVNGQPNGANPAWVILTATDGREVRIHHTFNVRHPSTWVWTVGDLRPLLVGFPIAFTATAHDPGSDDLAFAWSWGDGSPDGTATYYNNGVSPDPDPSPDLNPITATDVQAHAFAPGSHTVVLTVRDDDGGATQVTIAIDLG